MGFSDFKPPLSTGSPRRKIPVLRVFLVLTLVFFAWKFYTDTMKATDQATLVKNTPAFEAVDSLLEYEIFDLDDDFRQISVRLRKGTWPGKDELEALLPSALAREFREIVEEELREGRSLDVDYVWSRNLPEKSTRFRVRRGDTLRDYHRVPGRDSTLVWVEKSGCAWGVPCFVRPLDGGRLVRSFFLVDSGRSIPLPENVYLGGGEAPVRAVLDGRVLSLSPGRNSGSDLKIYHGENIFVDYRGLVVQKYIRPGREVKVGESLGKLPVYSGAELMLRLEIDGHFVDFEDEYLKSRPLDKAFPSSSKEKS